MYTPEMRELIKKVEATRAQRIAQGDFPRMTADEKTDVLKENHPDYIEEGFVEIKIGPNKGDKVPTELGLLLHGKSRLENIDIDLNKIDYETDVLSVICGGAVGNARC